MNERRSRDFGVRAAKTESARARECGTGKQNIERENEREKVSIDDQGGKTNAIYLPDRACLQPCRRV